jgi:hypothetical protein
MLWTTPSAADKGEKKILIGGSSRLFGLITIRPLRAQVRVVEAVEAMTLSVTLPFALGWFWWANAIAWRHRIFVWGA